MTAPMPVVDGQPQQYQQPPVPPSSKTNLEKVEDILIAGLAIYATAEALRRLLRLPKITGGAAASAVLWMLNTAPSRAVTPYRAAYVVSAIRRADTNMRHGDSVQEAMRREQPYFKQHLNAEAGRARSAAQTADVANRDGMSEDQADGTVANLPNAYRIFNKPQGLSDIVGWYTTIDSHTSAACLAANGHNFHATRGTIIGYPGSVHPHCRCHAGKPHVGAGWVDDAVRGIKDEPTSKKAASL